MNWQQELSTLLRPAGGGVYVVSTGKQDQQALQKRLYGLEHLDNEQFEQALEKRFLSALEQIPSARGIVLGIPSDTGAGYVRGANLGPQAIRSELHSSRQSWAAECDRLRIVDIGDVRVVPQLLHDDMLSDAQKRTTRSALYPEFPPAAQDGLPVAPLSIAQRVLDIVFEQNEQIVPFIIGGDHSTAWPVTEALSKARKQRWGIVQSDAHTDLLPERLGVKYCFATWSYHANELFGRDGRLVQVGIRASGRDKDHWENTLGVRQFWAEQCRRDPEGTLDQIIEHLQHREVQGIYFSNDIDGTDAALAPATGTPEPNGLSEEFLSALIDRLGKQIGIIAGDIVEVAPPLARKDRIDDRTLAIAAGYFRRTIRAALA